MSTVKERKWEKRESEILDAAQRLFQQKGFSRTTMDEIAEAALVAKGTIYQHFPTKDELVLAIMARGFDLLTEYVQRKVQPLEPGMDRLQVMIKAEIDFFHRQINLFEILHSEKSIFESEIGEQVYPAYKSHIEFLEKEIGAGVQAGAFEPDISAEDMATAIFAMIRGFGLRWLMEGKRWPITAESERTFRLARVLLEKRNKKLNAVTEKAM